MTKAKTERIKELEAELEWLFRDAEDRENKHRCIRNAYETHLSFGAMDTQGERAEYCLTRRNEITELKSLYQWAEYDPGEDEKELAYLFSDGMSVEEKLKALADAWWYATNSGYSDAMANRLMAGEEDAQTERWEQNCKNQYAIDRYYTYLTEAVNCP